MADVKNNEEKIELLYKKLTRLLSTGTIIRQVGTEKQVKIRDVDLTRGMIGKLSGYSKSYNSIYADIMAQTSNRIGRMFEYEMMEQTPEVAASLDIYADECLQKDDEDKILQIDSDDDRIKQILENLFYDILNVETHLWNAIRGMCKYGDYFWLLNVHEKYGVLGFLAVDPEIIERNEGEYSKTPGIITFNFTGTSYNKYMSTPYDIQSADKILQNWQVAHFRLASDNKFLPYGKSVIESSRKIWKQLILLEDAMMVYRVTRSPERRVFNIDVADLPPEQIPDYIEKVKNKMKKQPLVDPSTGNINLKYNVMPVHKDSIISLLDGRNITIENLAKEYNDGIINYVYSVQDKTHKIVPGKVSWCGKNYKANKIVEVTLDDGSIIKTAPEHPFIMRDGTQKRADQLNKNDSLMPFYEKTGTINKKDYKMIYNPNSNNYEFVHRLLKNQKVIDIDNSAKNTKRILVTHHKDGNRFNNNPDNLLLCSWLQHKKIHVSMNSSSLKRKQISEANKKNGNAIKMGLKYNGSDLHKKHNEIRKKAQIKSWCNNYDRRCNILRYKLNDECIEKIKYIFNSLNINNISTRKMSNILRSDDSFMNYFYSIQSNGKKSINDKMLSLLIAHTLNIEPKTYNNSIKVYELNQKSFINKYNFNRDCGLNHKVLNTKIINENVDVYCMTVVGLNGEDDRHNFAIGPCKGSDVHSSKCFVANSIDEDYFIPIRGEKKSTSIDTLPGAENLKDIDDITYMQKKLFTALKIPKAYLANEEDIASKSALSQLDIRFARTITRIQDAITTELTKIAIVHLYILGFSDEELVNYEIKLTSPSAIAEQMRLDLVKSRIEAANMARDSGLYDRTSIMKDILRLSDDDIRNINEMLIKDSKFRFILTNIENNGLDPRSDEYAKQQIAQQQGEFQQDENGAEVQSVGNMQPAGTQPNSQYNEPIREPVNASSVTPSSTMGVPGSKERSPLSKESINNMLADLKDKKVINESINVMDKIILQIDNSEQILNENII